MYLRKYNLFIPLCIALFTLNSCSQVTMVEQADLYQSTLDQVTVDNTSTTDNGFNEPVKQEGWN